MSPEDQESPGLLALNYPSLKEVGPWLNPELPADDQAETEHLNTRG